jgi:hypothetical protein
VVYARDQGDPFIGSGRRLAQWQTDPLDITQAAEDRVVVPFDEIELHRYLETEIPQLGFDDLEVSNRLYVRGDRARYVGGLVPDPSGPPRSLLPEKWVAAGLKHPSEHARTYVCTERIQMGGDLVTCMYLRTRIERGLMSIDGLIYFLPPLARIWSPDRKLLAGGRARAAWVPPGQRPGKHSPSCGAARPCAGARTCSGKTPARKKTHAARAAERARP